MLDSWLIESIVLIALLILLVAWLFLRIKTRNKSAEQKIQKILKPHQIDEANSILIPDGMGGLIEIERLIKLKQGLLILHQYSVNGHLFGAEKIEQWTQLVGGRSYKFANPLTHLLHVQQSLSLLVPKTPIFTHVVFTGHCNFPKGKPDNVSSLSTLDNDLQPLFKQAALPEQPLQSSWQSLLNIAKHHS